MFDIIVLSKLPTKNSGIYWGFSIGMKHKGKITFSTRIREIDMLMPELIRLSKKEIIEIKNHLKNSNFNEIKIK